MIQIEKQLFITFYTTADAMKFEKRCKAEGVSGRLAPVPRSITSDCGIGWRAKVSERPRLEALAAAMETAGLYEVEM